MTGLRLKNNSYWSTGAQRKKKMPEFTGWGECEHLHEMPQTDGLMPLTHTHSERLKSQRRCDAIMWRKEALDCCPQIISVTVTIPHHHIYTAAVSFDVGLLWGEKENPIFFIRYCFSVLHFFRELKKSWRFLLRLFTSYYPLTAEKSVCIKPMLSIYC